MASHRGYGRFPVLLASPPQVTEVEAALSSLDPNDCDTLFSSDTGLEKFVKTLVECDGVEREAQALLSKLKGSGGSAGGKVERQMLIARLKRTCPEGLAWEDVELALYRTPLEQVLARP